MLIECVEHEKTYLLGFDAVTLQSALTHHVIAIPLVTTQERPFFGASTPLLICPSQSITMSSIAEHKMSDQKYNECRLQS